MSTAPLTVELAERAYPIHFSDSLTALKNDVAALRAAGRTVRVLSDANVLAAQPDVLANAGFLPDEILNLPAGEQTKSVEFHSQALSFLAADSMNRDCALFAFGGGVIGDLTGYVAASYLRGIDFYQIPTTLLSMVDSSVGGKTGINLPEGKNLVGAFWQPKAVYIETALLETLPPREFAAGMAEVIKYGMLYDFEFFKELEEVNTLTASSPELAGIVRRCCAIKAEIVADDEKETAASGGRALLNLGHTFAHAVENVAGYGQYLHGEAVAIGLNLATQLSVQLGQVDAADIDRANALIEKCALPTRLNAPLPITDLMAAMQKDKKNRAGKLRFVSMEALGKAVTTDGVEATMVEGLWKTVGAE
ncbi:MULTISPECIES: 3-dehydroquinate synthase [unclassified Lentimonas]|uniref:3-dehydroquinate synthase n=1 Tax=unclassified Lentimonas TaxID=2630993 RepID=UPI001321176B|nr:MULTISPECIES: 3-dehydroquinate synthase [unclassified Lentimonas]CAA6679430.1 3-dehydroquinate synthase (EC [Lentimonas sp. CC4]CAA6687101.1 3-dehydroquinate synthase (EC [Lentimonas sp. CC6]CAA7075552.1 3-dehydroquinate synthase (EC [Lentimonas sp. CC4]CAA7170319.1 3-dehydroquinate synthase (EC [Lentimonas sp. CC21]CAA7182613.1 3-dehydroquinate synthase (EC [Lentimonas sp. CC8]